MSAFHLVEINLISAQSLKPPPISRRLQMYAVAYIQPSAKLRTSVDRRGADNPTWNDKFVFRVPASHLSPDSPTALSVEIYASGGWYFPDSLVGAVRLLLANLRLLNLPLDAPSFTAAGVRRSSGRIHGVLNVGAAVLSRVPAFVTEALAGSSAVGYRDFIRDNRRGQLIVKECNIEVEGNGSDCEGGESWLCGLGFRRKIHVSPSDQNLAVCGFREKDRRRWNYGRF